MFKRIFRQTQRDPEPEFSPELKAPEVPTFTEIGGSPVPGLTLRHVLRGHTGWIGRIAWSPDGAYLASPSSDKTIRIWDAHSGACVRTLDVDTGDVNSVAWSPDGQRLASTSANQIRLWHAGSGKPLQTLEGHTKMVLSVAWSPDGRRLASASFDNTIRLWETTSGKHLQTLTEDNRWFNDVAWSRMEIASLRLRVIAPSAYGKQLAVCSCKL